MPVGGSTCWCQRVPSIPGAGGPQADAEELLPRGAGEPGFRVDAGVDEKELLPLDPERNLPQPGKQLAGDRQQPLHRPPLIRLAELDLLSPRQHAELAQHPVVVVAEDHLRSALADGLPNPGRVGAAAEGVAGQQQAVGAGVKADLPQQAAQLAAAAVDVAGEYGSHEKSGSGRGARVTGPEPGIAGVSVCCPGWAAVSYAPPFFPELSDGACRKPRPQKHPPPAT